MPRPQTQIVTFDDIDQADDRFNHRSGGLSTTHCDTLLGLLARGTKLDPIWVWEAAPEGASSVKWMGS